MHRTRLHKVIGSRARIARLVHVWGGALLIALVAGAGMEIGESAAAAPADLRSAGAGDPASPVLADSMPLKAPSISRPRGGLQCVPYARDLSNIQIRGDAWTWWASAKGRYRRGHKPAQRAVLVFKRRGNSRGHLAVVTHIVDDRVIIASHANWLNRGRIHHNTPIRDVSPNNDWSSVQVWYIPGRHYGTRRYRTYGFIYPALEAAAR